MSKILENKNNKMKQTEVKNNNEYLICFKNIMVVLKIFGIFPFINLNEATKFGRLLSITITIISLSMYAVSNTRAQIQLYRMYCNTILKEVNFVNIVRFILVTIINMIFLTFPFLTWSRSEHLKKYWHNWMVFQTEIEKFTKISYKSPARNKIQRIFVLLIVCLITIVLIYQTQGQNPSLIKADLFQLSYRFSSLVNISMFWVMNNIYMSATAKKIIILVRQALQNDNPQNLSRLIDLWVMLCDLNEEFSSSHSILFLIIFSQMIILTVLNIFLAIVVFIYFDDKNFALTNICGTSVSIMILVSQCESANSVIHEVVDELRSTLLKENMSFKDKKSIRMIQLFLHTIETKNPKINFSGYMIIDRSTVTSVVREIINFLVVLKQFSPS